MPWTHPLLALLLLAVTPAGAAGETATPLPVGQAKPIETPVATDPGGQSSTPPPAPAAPGQEPTQGDAYVIGADDKLSVRVIGHPEFSGTTDVTRRGTIILKILGEVPARGLTAGELQRDIAQRLRDGYLRDPQVLVEVADYANMRVWVFGHVKNPGELTLRGPTEILDLLKMVGDLDETAGGTLTIDRQTDELDDDGTPLGSDQITVDLDALLKDGDLRHNLPLQNGDKIWVPGSSAKVYAFGEVANPGFYAYHDGMRLAELIQMAGGMSEYASQKKVKIRRVNQDKPIKVNLKDYYKKGKLENNVPLEEGDIVLIGSSFLF